MGQKEIEIAFKKVMSLVADGLNISDSLDQIGVNRSTFYNRITKDQKRMLQYQKTLNTKYGTRLH